MPPALQTRPARVDVLSNTERERGVANMLKNTRRTRGVLAAAVGVNLALALAVGAGAMPRPGDGGDAHPIAAASSVAAEAPARQPGDTVATIAEATTTTST